MLALLLFISLFSITLGQTICPQGYTLVNGQKCLKVVTTTANHWQAEVNCKADSGTLVNIKSSIDNRGVFNLINNSSINTPVWIGLSCFGDGYSDCYWDDGSRSPWPYTNFMDYQYGPDDRCVVMSLSNQGKWFRLNCNNQNDYSNFPYVCEVPASYNSSYCYNDNYNGYCYTTSDQLFFSPSMANMSTASQMCSNYGPLPSIHSNMDVEHIQNLYRYTNTSTVYLGAQIDSTGRFNWLDGSAWDFEFFDPLNFQTGKCLVMDIHGYGLWTQVDCAQELNFLCQFKIYVPPTTTPILKYEPENLMDVSNCNSTLYMAPGEIASIGYPDYSATPSYCSWNLVALGPYQLGIFIDFWATYGKLTILDEYGNNIGQWMGEYDRVPFSRYTPFNVATVTFEPRSGNGTNVDRGFHAVVLPI